MTTGADAKVPSRAEPKRVAAALKFVTMPPFDTTMEPKTCVPAPPVPALLAVGCQGALLARCRKAAASISVELQVTELLTLAATAAVARPLALLISADLYGFDPEEFDALAQTIGAARLLVEEHEPIDRFAARLREALASRASTAASLPRSAVQDVDPPKRSGIRWTAITRALRTG